MIMIKKTIAKLLSCGYRLFVKDRRLAVLRWEKRPPVFPLRRSVPLCILAPVLAVFCSCASLEMVQTINPVSKVFYADYQQVWRATMLALENYPIDMENNEKGYLKTESIQSETIWKFPFFRDKNFNSFKYRLHIKLVKGHADSLSMVKVLVLKKIFIRKGFMNNPERVPSDGLEEKTILYRILREINIEQAITNYHQSSS